MSWAVTPKRDDICKSECCQKISSETLWHDHWPPCFTAWGWCRVYQSHTWINAAFFQFRISGILLDSPPASAEQENILFPIKCSPRAWGLENLAQDGPVSVLLSLPWDMVLFADFALHNISHWKTDLLWAMVGLITRKNVSQLKQWECIQHKNPVIV